MPRVAAVLFDLDGTLVDSAPDLAGTANDMRGTAWPAPLALRGIAPACRFGRAGHAGCGLRSEARVPGYEAHRLEFLAHYQSRLLQQSATFPRSACPAGLNAAAMPWGIVTNKALHLAMPLVKGLGLLEEGRVLVGGDSTPHTKPHPAPLLEAARRLAVAPQSCIYVGDDERDMQAGLAAGMLPVAAAWGYLGPHADVPPGVPMRC
jgi:2-phosphoglycolate phosphatase